MEKNIETIKMIDFGLAKKYKKGEIMDDLVGSPYYVAPEVLEGEYTNQVDMWSLGVVLYVMLSGKVPFPGSTKSEVFEKLKAGYFTFSHKPFRYCSLEVKDLISKLIHRDPKKRLSSKRAY